MHNIAFLTYVDSNIIIGSLSTTQSLDPFHDGKTIIIHLLNVNKLTRIIVGQAIQRSKINILFLNKNIKNTTVLNVYFVVYYY